MRLRRRLRLERRDEPGPEQGDRVAAVVSGRGDGGSKEVIDLGHVEGLIERSSEAGIRDGGFRRIQALGEDDFDVLDPVTDFAF